MKRAKYTEPSDFIPKDIRKKFELGEFDKSGDEKKEKKERDLNQSFRDYVNGKK